MSEFNLVLGRKLLGGMDLILLPVISTSVFELSCSMMQFTYDIPLAPISAWMPSLEGMQISELMDLNLDPELPRDEECED